MHSSFSKAALNQSRLSACPDASSPSASAQIPSSYSCTKVKSWISVPVSSESSPGLGAGPSIRSTEPFAPACCSIISKTVPHASFRAPSLPYFFCKQLRIFPGEPRRRYRSRCSHNNLHAGLFTKIREFIKKEKSNFSSVSSILLQANSPIRTTVMPAFSIRHRSSPRGTYPNAPDHNRFNYIAISRHVPFSPVSFPINCAYIIPINEKNYHNNLIAVCLFPC